jgi:hypothetical protein
MTSQNCLTIISFLSLIFMMGADEDLKSFQTQHTVSDSKLPSMLEDWADLQRNTSVPALILKPKYGLGNQLLSLVSGLALALISERRLFVVWEEPFRGLLEPPFDWSLPKDVAAAAAAGRASVSFTAHSPDFPAAARALACGDLAALLPSSAVVVESDQFFLPLVLLSPQVHIPAGEAYNRQQQIVIFKETSHGLISAHRATAESTLSSAQAPG